MGRLVMVSALAAGLFGLYYLTHPNPVPPPPPALTLPPAPALSDAELKKIRASTLDSDPKVRWAAIELLYRLKDPLIDRMVADILTIDSDAEVRRHVVDMLKQGHDPANAKSLLIALKDGEKEVRIAALLALGELGDSSFAPAVTNMLADYDPDVRMQALRTMGRLQERRQLEYQALAGRLKSEYQRSIKAADPQLRDVDLPK